MDLLKRQLAPLTDAAWKLIDETASQVLKSQLTARRFVDVVGPKGVDFAAVGLGRLDVPAEQLQGSKIAYGVHRVQPLVEVRAPFELDVWELDNLERGAKDVDLEPLIGAAREAARFEDRAIFDGFEPSGIVGLSSADRHPKMKLHAREEAFLETISGAVMRLEKASIGGAYALLLGPEPFRYAASAASGYPLLRRIGSLLDGPIIHCDDVTGGYVVSLRGGDFELSLGQELSIGYHSHDTRKVRLYLSESFTFRLLEPAAVVSLSFESD
ncbi:MAG TPA: family 1 encapsulin nanocompartment shell protein [Vicinamibacteria bacterium]|nr:family 1 encapsulin nanocompartment shell protein [Vicinamibacteria bacterium]